MRARLNIFQLFQRRVVQGEVFRNFEWNLFLISSLSQFRYALDFFFPGIYLCQRRNVLIWHELEPAYATTTCTLDLSS